MGLPVFWEKEKTPRNNGVSCETIFKMRPRGVEPRSKGPKSLVLSITLRTLNIPSVVQN